MFLKSKIYSLNPKMFEFTKIYSKRFDGKHCEVHFSLSMYRIKLTGKYVHTCESYCSSYYMLLYIIDVYVNAVRNGSKRKK